VGFGILAVVGAAALCTPFLNLPDPFALSSSTFSAPVRDHLMGTDNLGRDTFSAVMWGSRVSLAFGVAVAALSAALGTVAGMIPGYFGGIVDDIFSRLFEIFLSIPALILVVVVVSVFGTNIFLLMLVVGLTIWPSNAKIMRAQVLSLREREYVSAARASGATDVRILRQHVLPNAIQPVVANSALQMAGAVVLEASLSFLGLGDPNLISWGRMLQTAQAYYFNAWWMAAFPGAAILITVLGFNLVGDAVSRLLNPRTRQF
jgi:peptide/nickel transport system permease protein